MIIGSQMGTYSRSISHLAFNLQSLDSLNMPSHALKSSPAIPIIDDGGIADLEDGDVETLDN